MQAASGWRNHDTAYKVGSKRIEKLQVKNWSSLEEWAILNRDILTEAEEIDYKCTRVEGWGYQKFRAINPDDRMLEGYGVEISSPSKPGKSSKQETSSLPLSSTRNQLTKSQTSTPQPIP